MRKIIYALLAIFLISTASVMAQESRLQLISLNNGQYTVTYFAEDLGNIIKATQRQNPGRTETLLYLHSFEKNTRIGLLKSGNIRKRTTGSGRSRNEFLEVKNQTHGGIFEMDHFTINGTFKISTEAIENGHVTRFELDRDAILTVLTNDQDGELLVRCRANDRNCLRTVEFIEREDFIEQYFNLRGEAEIIRPETEQYAEITMTTLQNIRGTIITEETIEAGTRLKVIGIPYLARRPSSLISWNRLKSDSTTLFEQSYAPNGIASSTKITASSELNVYDTCAKQNCGLTIFEALENSQAIFLNGNTPILQLIEGKMGVVETEDLYTECMIDPSNICAKIEQNGRTIKIRAKGNSKIKLEPLQGIRRINFDDLIGEDSEIVLEDNGRRLVFSKEGAKYTGPGAWYSLRASFKMPVILQGKRHILECKAESQQCFVDGKLTLGPELKSCNSNEECGPQEKCSDNVCVVKQLCIFHSGDEQASRTRADILVISDGTDLQQLGVLVDNLMFGSGALFNTEPFRSNRNAFNVWIMSARQAYNDQDMITFERSATRDWKRKCPVADYLVVLSDNAGDRAYAFRRAAYIPTSVVAENAVGGAIGDLKRTITHEFGGHLIGGLTDEYAINSQSTTFAAEASANCATTKEEANTKFGSAIANQAILNSWTGCGGDCNWETVKCNQWYTTSPTIPINRRTIVTQTLMGLSSQYGEFNEFDKRIIERKLGRRTV